MATERITILVEEKGSRVVKRRLDTIAESATIAGRDVNFLKGALKTLGGGYIIRELIRVTDVFTTMQNRLRLVTDDAVELNAVFDELVQVSNRTRSSLQNNVELFNRVSLAVRELGTSQQEVLNFTESLNQAIILSGANSLEAAAGLIQLSQGLASGVLRGDELRSVLEQLPAVADVLAKELGVTRGQLRMLGSEGKITAEVVTRAFRNAREELGERFATTIPTVGQSFQVLKNSLIAYIGAANQSMGITAAFSKLVLLLADNVALLVRSLVAYGAVVAAVKVAPYVQSTLQAVVASNQLHRAVATGSAVMLGSAEALRQQTLMQVESLAVELEKTAAILAQTRAEAARAIVVRGSTAELVAQAAVQKQIAMLETQLTAQHAALTAAQTRLTKATRAARIEGTMLGGALLAIKRGIVAITVAVAANPLGALLVAITAGTALMAVFSDNIKLATDSSATLRDFGVAAFEEYKISMMDGLAALREWLAGFEPLRQVVEAVFGDININMVSFLQVAAQTADGFLGFFVGAFYALGRLFQQLPNLVISAVLAAVNGAIAMVEGLINGAITAINYLVGKAESLINGMIDSLNTVLDLLPGVENAVSRISLGELDKIDLGRLENNLGQAASDLSEAVVSGFVEGFEKIDGVQRLVDRSIAKANAAADARNNKTGVDLSTAPAGGVAPVTGGPSPAFEEIIAGLREQQQLLRMTNEQRTVANDLIRIQKDLEGKGVQISAEQEKTLQQELERVQLLQQVSAALDSVRGASIDMAAAQEELSRQVAAGDITIEQATRAYMELENAMLATSTSAEAGFRRGMNSIMETINDTASMVEDTLVNAFNSAEDALVEFVQTGTFNFSSLVDSILADLTRLLARQALMSAIGAFGGGAGGFASLLGNMAGSRAAGGPVTAGGMYQINERGQELFVPKTAGTIVPAQQTAAMAASSVAAPPVNVHITNVTDPNEVAGALSTPGGEKAILNVIRRNKKAIQGIM